MIISSQYTIDESIVEDYISRIEAGETFVATIATLDSDEMSEYGITGLLIDGHHRMEAYRRLGMEIEFVEADYDYQAELDNLGMDGFLAAHWNDGDWYNVENERLVF